MKRVQCEFCGKVLMPSGVWAWVMEPMPDVIGTCKPCGDAKRRVEKARYWNGVREGEARKAQTFGPAPEGTDPFKGFRDGE